MEPNREFLDLGLPSQYHRRLERHGIRTVKDLCAKTERELRSFRFIGDQTIQAIQEALHGNGLSLAQPPETPERMVTIKLTSPSCEEEIEIPSELWDRFQQGAKDLAISPDHLFRAALEDYLNHSGDPANTM